MNDETRKKIRKIIGLASKLGWVQKDPSEGSDNMYMHLADVEKVIIATLEKEYEDRMENWVIGAEHDGTACLPPTDLKIRELLQLRKAVEAQRTLLAPLIKGERCIYKR